MKFAEELRALRYIKEDLDKIPFLYDTYDIVETGNDMVALTKNGMPLIQFSNTIKGKEKARRYMEADVLGEGKKRFTLCEVTLDRADEQTSYVGESYYSVKDAMGAAEELAYYKAELVLLAEGLLDDDGIPPYSITSGNRTVRLRWKVDCNIPGSKDVYWIVEEYVTSK